MKAKRSKPSVTDESVTVVVTRRVVPGRESEYQKWASEVSRVSKQFPGHLGATIRGPFASNEFHIIFRYDTVDHLRKWDSSAERAACIQNLDGIVVGDDRVDYYTGLEYLFDSSVVPIRKYKMALVLTIVVFLMLLLLRPVISALFPNVAPSVQLLLTVIIQVVVMTYIVMPLVTRLLNRWLHR